MRVTFFCFIFIVLIISESDSYSFYRSKEGDSSTPRPGVKHEKNKSVLFIKYEPCGSGIKCVPPILCPAHLQIEEDKKPKPCELADGFSHGLCCTTGLNHTVYTRRRKIIKKTAPQPRSSADFEKEVHNRINDLNKRAQTNYPDARKIEKGSPEFYHNLVFRTHPSQQQRMQALARQAEKEMVASRAFREHEQIPEDEFLLQMHNERFAGGILEHHCQPQGPSCPPVSSKFRNPSGVCNNLRKSNWGAAGTAMERLLPPVYLDGVWDPKIFDSNGDFLPSSREISRNLFADVDRPHPFLNLLTMQFGQFITHDVTMSSTITDHNGNPISCCTSGDREPIPPQFAHFACMPIIISPADDFYAQFGKGCMNFVRTALAPNSECEYSYGKQMSKVTHFLDGSGIYGSDVETESGIREHQGGRLRMFLDFNRELLPLARPGDKEDECTQTDSSCFVAGDTRVNQIISLTSLHLLFAREHNRVAKTLEQLNPHWPDDLIFLEAKRIIIAEFQIIIYREWLPLIIGTNTMKRFELELQPSGYSTDYDPWMNPSVTSEFTTAAFRFGHSTVDGRFKIGHHEVIPIPDVMFNPSRLRLGHFFDEMLRTMSSQPMQEVDSSVTKGLSRHLFRGSNPFGMDLVSINIQRGYDHGIRPYNDYLEVSGSPRIRSFNEFGDDVGHKLSHVYSSPDDISLWIGGLLEQSQADALVGPTFSDIIADQFTRLRRGDRYFHEHDPSINPGAFSIHQLDELRKVSLSKIICLNADHITTFAPHAFIQPGQNGNHPKDCNLIHGPDFTAWKE